MKRYGFMISRDHLVTDLESVNYGARKSSTMESLSDQQLQVLERGNRINDEHIHHHNVKEDAPQESPLRKRRKLEEEEDISWVHVDITGLEGRQVCGEETQ